MLLKPGVTGVEMDDIARNYIVKNGYPEYPHGLGHQVGKEVHDGGAGLFPRWEKYGNAPFLKLKRIKSLQSNQDYLLKDTEFLHLKKKFT